MNTGDDLVVFNVHGTCHQRKSSLGAGRRVPLQYSRHGSTRNTRLHQRVYHLIIKLIQENKITNSFL